MVQLKIQTNFVKLKIAIKEPSLSDCLGSDGNKSGLLIKGTLKNVSECDTTVFQLCNIAHIAICIFFF